MGFGSSWDQHSKDLYSLNLNLEVEETIEEMDEGDRSNVMGSTGEGFSLTMDGMSNSLAMSFQWLDKVGL